MAGKQIAMGMVGKKIGMSRVFNETGESVPVTVIEVKPNTITQIKTTQKEGYDAIKVTTGSKRPSRINKPTAGQFAKAGVEAGRGFWEFRVNANSIDNFQVGQALTVDTFHVGQMIDVSGTSKGKGFAGVIKRHNFRMQDATHGNSRSHRAPGSIGQNQSPGRVFPGKLMAGQMGNKRCTTQNLVVVRVDVERNLLLVRGAVPGSVGGDVIIQPAVKDTQAVETA